MGTKRSLAPFPSDPAVGVTPRSAAPSSCLRAKLSSLVTLCSSAQLLLQEPLAFYSHGWTRPAPPQQHWSCSVPWGSPKRVVILGPEVPMSVLPPRQPAVGLEVGTGACAAPLGITVAICSRDPSRKLSLGWPPAPHGVTPCPSVCSPWCHPVSRRVLPTAQSARHQAAAPRRGWRLLLGACQVLEAWCGVY